MSYMKTQKDNTVKSGKQYMYNMRSLTEVETIKKNQTEILELKNTINEMRKCNRECQQQNESAEEKKI